MDNGRSKGRALDKSPNREQHSSYTLLRAHPAKLQREIRQAPFLIHEVFVPSKCMCFVPCNAIWTVKEQSLHWIYLKPYCFKVADRLLESACSSSCREIMDSSGEGQ